MSPANYDIMLWKWTKTLPPAHISLTLMRLPTSQEKKKKERVKVMSSQLGGQTFHLQQLAAWCGILFQSASLPRTDIRKSNKNNKDSDHVQRRSIPNGGPAWGLCCVLYLSRDEKNTMMRTASSPFPIFPDAHLYFASPKDAGWSVGDEQVAQRIQTRRADWGWQRLWPWSWARPSFHSRLSVGWLRSFISSPSGEEITWPGTRQRGTKAAVAEVAFAWEPMTKNAHAQETRPRSRRHGFFLPSFVGWLVRANYLR